jgi:hypothetical protein
LEDEGAGTGAGERGVGDALGVDIAEGGEAVFEEGGAGFAVADGEEGGDVLGGGVVGAADIEGFGDGGEFRAAGGEGGGRRVRGNGGQRNGRRGEGWAGRGAGRGGGVFGVVGVELEEEGAGGEFEAAEGFRLEAVDRGDAVEELVAGGAGFFLALVGEGGAGGDADGGELIGEDGEVGRGHAGPADEDDGDDGDDEDEGGDEAVAVEEFAGGGEGGVGAGGGVEVGTGRSLPGAAGAEAADEEFELVTDGHGEGGERLVTNVEWRAGQAIGA